MDVCIRTLFGVPAAVGLTRSWPKGTLLALEGYKRSVRADAKVSVISRFYISPQLSAGRTWTELQPALVRGRLIEDDDEADDLSASNLEVVR